MLTKMIVVLILVLIALWQLPSLLETKPHDPGKNKELLPEGQSVEEVTRNYKETFNDQMLIDQKKVRDEQMRKAMEEGE